MTQDATQPGAASGPTRIVLIGRAAGNDLVLRQPSVSARHVRVIFGPDGMWIEDLGSRNGTFVGAPPRRIALDNRLVCGDAALPENALRDCLERTKPRAAEEGVIRLVDEPGALVAPVLTAVDAVESGRTEEALVFAR